ncbi:MAG: permease [Cocleimonas sp.]
MMEFLNNLLALSLEAAPWLVLGLVIGGLIKSLIPTSFLQKHLSGSGFPSIVKAAIFGAPLPLCSCGVIPAALGLRRAGASKPATVSFLVSTPETGIDSVSISYALLGPFMAITRPIAAITSAIVAGLLVGRSEDDKPVSAMANAAETSCCSSKEELAEETAVSSSEESCCSTKKEAVAESSCCDTEASKTVAETSCCSVESEAAKKEESTSCCSTKEAVAETSCCSTETPKAVAETSCCSTEASKEETSCCSSSNEEAPKPASALQTAWDGIVYSFTDLFDKVLFWLVIGLVFAALVKTFIPVTFLAEWGSGLPAMLVMLVIGIPMYVCATASTPIAAGLLLAGVSPGVAMVYLMAGPATNISTLGVIGKELGRRSLIAYLTGVGVVALLTGFIVDYLVTLWNIDVQAQISHSHEMVPAVIAWASLLILLAVVIKLKAGKLLSFRAVTQ